jgi:hypothetical protein
VEEVFRVGDTEVVSIASESTIGDKKTDLHGFSFRKIFSEGGSGGGFPRRSLSTLSKMALSATNEPVPV